MKLLVLLTLASLFIACSDSDASEYYKDPKDQEFARAINRNDIKTMRKLLSEGVDINLVGLNDETFLKYAYRKKSFEAFKELVKLGINLYHMTPDDRTILVGMVRDQDTKYFEYLLENGLDPNFKGKGTRLSFLQQAVVVGKKPELITMLLKKGADPYWSQGSIFFSALSSERYEYCLAFISGVKYIDQSLDWVKGGIKTFQRTQVINEEEKKTREKIREVLAEKGVKVDFEYKDIVKHRDLTVLFD